MVAVAEHIKVPELRFPEFSGEWKRGIFDDFVEGFTSGSTPSRSIPEYFDGDIPWVNSGDLDYKIIQSTPQNITEKAVIDTNLKIHQPGTFLMAITGLEAAGTRGSCAILGVNATTNQSCMALHVRGSKDIRFFYQFYLSVGQRYAFRYCQGTKQQSYNGQLVRKLPIAFPNEPTEQQKIAEFLTAVDEKIGKLKRKKELLEAYKKGAMQKLFSQEIRFKDDQGNPYPDWEESRLGEFIKVNPSDMPLPNSFYYIDLDAVDKGILKDAEKTSLESAPSRAQRFLEVGDVLFQMVRPYQKNNLWFREKTGEYVASTGYAVLRSKCQSFTYQLLHTPQFNNHVRVRCTGSSYPAINTSELRLIPVQFPSLPEQQKIAEFLTGIDDKITAVANQIGQAAEFKKGLLQKMFVSSN